MNDKTSCPGIPEQCEHSQAVISQALEGIPTTSVVDAARAELGQCFPCVQQIDLQIRFKLTVVERAPDQAPASLQLRITEALGRVDLGDVEVADL